MTFSTTSAPETIDAAYRQARQALLDERHPDGYWIGELSTSALSTATAVMALEMMRRAGASAHSDLIDRGLAWLADHQNDDGGWGDTVKSFSNISTTLLCLAAMTMTERREQYTAAMQQCEHWLRTNFGETQEDLAEALRARYGKDRTFAVPILTACALAGLLDWSDVPSLPFELACLPQSWFRFVRLHVVSYALPALIAIGQCVYHHRPPGNPFTSLIRRAAIRRSLKVLERIQPPNGGFLEATPLTSFVTMSLASIGRADHLVAKRGTEFIVASVRPDGSWPIDTNLSTWVTTLSINALAGADDLKHLDKKEALLQWLLDQQFTKRHPYTGAAPGAWTWTPLPGGVPDADDTPGAILALGNLKIAIDRERFQKKATGDEQLNHPPVTVLPDVLRGCRWLMNLCNRDGGWPTFCKGWSGLPFDRSGSDLTAHVLRAYSMWWHELINAWNRRKEAKNTDPAAAAVNINKVTRQFERGNRYLERQQRPDGSWLPLWFGNQHAPDEENPTYGTARVLASYRDLELLSTKPAQKGIAWLLENQNEDGGWGGVQGTPSSIEETALAVEVLLDCGDVVSDAVNQGLDWLITNISAGRLSEPTPIGFYFAKLWYFEKLYPIIFAVAALGRARRKLQRSDSPIEPNEPVS